MTDIANDPHANGQRLTAAPAQSFPAQRMPMLWRERIPCATLSVIAGEPGAGKSTLGALIAAEVSQDGHNVLVSNAEDDLRIVTRPRLDVAQANLRLVHLMPHAAAPILMRDLDELAALIRQLDARLCMLDPIGAHFSPERMVHDRPRLRQLIQMAQETGCAILGMHHTTKMGTVGGPNGGLAGTARAVYIYGIDPEDEDRRALACEKSNGFQRPPTLLFDHDITDILVEGAISDAGRLRSTEESTATARTVALSRGKRLRERDEACVEWLTAYLATAIDPPFTRAAQDVKAAGALVGWSWSTLTRASTLLRLEKRPERYHGPWLWMLPADHPLRMPVDPDLEPLA